jgi:ectoine hydroxylase
LTTSTTAIPAGITPEQRADFDRDGYIIVPGVLSAAEIAHYTAAVDDVYAAHAATGDLGPDGQLHKLSAVASCPPLAGLASHPTVFPLVWSILGWNVHIYHSHLDVHPTVTERTPYRFEWHQDGGRQNRELETNPRPRMSVKLAFWLSDVSQPGRGNFQVVPGSHLTNRIDGPPRRDMPWPAPEGAIEVCANPGDVVFFDRRIWHARSFNYSDITRKAAFFGYTYRWVARRDEVPAPSEEYTPIQRQLFGLLDAPTVLDPELSGDHAWGHFPQDTPLHGYLKENNLLDPSYPPLQP